MHIISQKSFSLLCLVALSFLLASTAVAKMGSINSENVNVRSGPGTKYAAKWQYGKGVPLKIVTRKGSWAEVKDFENDSGWIYKKFLSDTPHMVVKVNRDRKKKINIRSGPGTKYEIVGQAYYGVVFETVKQVKGWVQVKHESGLSGWIKRSLLWGF